MLRACTVDKSSAFARSLRTSKRKILILELVHMFTSYPFSLWNKGAYETRTTTATRTSLKNTSSRYSYRYETISCRVALKMCSNCRGIKLVWVSWKRRERTENSSSCANVLHRTLNLVISRRHLGDDGKEMYHNVKRTRRDCRAIVFAH